MTDQQILKEAIRWYKLLKLQNDKPLTVEEAIEVSDAYFELIRSGIPSASRGG
jgi:hypothetical protein